MYKKALLALMLVMAMLLSSCALIEKDMDVDRATEIIRMGDTVYTKGQVQGEVNYQLAYMSTLYAMYGLSYDVTSPSAVAEMQESVIKMLVDDMVTAAKAKELGLDILTEEEQAKLEENVQTSWQSNLDSVKSSYFADSELTGEELDAAVEAKAVELGLDRDAITDYEKSRIVADKLRQHVVADVTVSDEEIQAEYDKQVADAQTKYTDTPSRYATDVEAQSTIYYRPDGYRMVKQILVAFLDEDKAAVESLQTSVVAQQSAQTTLTNQLSGLGVTDNLEALTAQVTVTLEKPEGVSTLATVSDLTDTFDESVTEEVSDLVRQLAEAKAKQTFFEEQLEAAKAKAFAAIDEAADDVLAQLDAGADWDTLMAEKTQDPGMQGDRFTAKNGYAVSEARTSFDKAFVDAAMALEKVGDVSPKTKGASGYYILQYTSEVEEGAVALDEVRDALHDSLLTTKQNTTYTDTVAQWVEAADVKINRDALKD